MCGSREDMQKVAVGNQSSCRTQLRASEKVGRTLTYQAACRTESGRSCTKQWATSVTQENNPSNTGVMRAIAFSDHCRNAFCCCLLQTFSY
jgi:hypothetical protein